VNARPIVLGALVAAVLILGVSAFAATPQGATLVIHHQVRGCHSWSLNGGPYIVHQSLRLARGGSLTVTNNDLMVQELVKTAGPAVNMKLVTQSHMGKMPVQMGMGKAGPYAMAHMGAMLTVTFAQAGTYRFTLMDRGDYFKGIKTIGPDNVPTLVVVVA